MTKQSDHVIFNGLTRYMECRHCGISQHLALPAPMRDAALQMMEFSKTNTATTTTTTRVRARLVNSTRLGSVVGYRC